MNPKQYRFLLVIIAFGGVLMLGLYLSQGYPWWSYAAPVAALGYSVYRYQELRRGDGTASD